MSVRRLPARIAVGTIRLYQTYISPLRMPACRFTPSCSAYAVTAIERFGLARGSWLAVRRLSRCHPFHRGGHDPVPPRVAQAGSSDGQQLNRDQHSRPAASPRSTHRHAPRSAHSTGASRC